MVKKTEKTAEEQEELELARNFILCGISYIHKYVPKKDRNYVMEILGKLFEYMCKNLKIPL